MSGFTKKALIRDGSIPPGQPAPMYLNCVCGATVNMGSSTDVHDGRCAACGQGYDARGYLEAKADPEVERVWASMMAAVEVYAVPGEHNIIDTIDPTTGLTCINREDEAGVRRRYPAAVRLTMAAWMAAQAERQHTPITWYPTDEETYRRMLEVLPPALWLGGAFLVGEPMDHDATTGKPRFQGYWHRHGIYLAASRPMTCAELRKAVQP